MSTNFSISAIFDAKDKFSAKLHGMQGAMSKFGKSTISSGEAIAKQMDKVSRLSIKAASAEMAAAKAAQLAAKLKEKGNIKVAQAAQKAADSTRASANAINSALHSEEQALARVGNAAQKMKRSFNFASLRSQIASLASGTKSLLSSLSPGIGSFGTALAAGYAGKKLLDNSSEYESIETTTLGLIKSEPGFKKRLTPAQMDKLAYEQGKLAENAGNTSIGEFRDYAQMGNVNIARGIAPDKRMFDTFGALAASMPSSFDKAGQFLETYKSIMRGEMATSDNIPGVKGHIDKKTHGAYFQKGSDIYQLGKPGSANYSQNLNNALTAISEKYFKELGDMQGKTFEAKWSTMVSSMSRGLDDMLRKTSWWEKGIKPAVDGISDSFKNMTPELTHLSETIYNMFHGGALAGVSNSIENFIRNTIKTIDDTLGGLSQAKIQETFGQLVDGVNSAVQTIRNLSDVINTIAHPLDALGSGFNSGIRSIGEGVLSHINTGGNPILPENRMGMIGAKDPAQEQISNNTQESVKQQQVTVATLEQQNQLLQTQNQNTKEVAAAIVNGFAGLQFNITQNVSAPGQVSTNTSVMAPGNVNINSGRTVTGTPARVGK